MRIKRQQKRGGVMIRTGIIGNDLLGLFLIKKGVKINSQSYCALLKKFLIPWIKCQNKTNLKELVFQQDNAPTQSSKLTKAWFNANNIKVMKWSLYSHGCQKINT